MSDIITRTFTKERESGYETRHRFTTHSTIFEPEKYTGDFNKLLFYLRDVFIDGIKPGKKPRESTSKMPNLIIKTEPIKSDLIEFAKAADYHQRGKYQHESVQNYLWENDPSIFATEIPLWSDEDEGFADILRVHKIKDHFHFEIADFKPNAIKDKKAPSQDWHYCKNFCLRTGIPSGLVTGIYFDDTNAFKIINPF